MTSADEIGLFRVEWGRWGVRRELPQRNVGRKPVENLG